MPATHPSLMYKLQLPQPLFHAIGVWITATPRGGNEDSKIHLTTGYGTAHSIG